MDRDLPELLDLLVQLVTLVLPEQMASTELLVKLEDLELMLPTALAPLDLLLFLPLSLMLQLPQLLWLVIQAPETTVDVGPSIARSTVRPRPHNLSITHIFLQCLSNLNNEI